MRTTLLLLLCSAPAFGAPSREADPTWKAALDRVVPAVVMLRVTGTRDFDTEDARSSTGTGFIIDRENGWILTNRHMVHAGPVVAEAVLENSEEIDLQAIYRDPVHDFGFYRFDPADVKHMELNELVLYPQGATVGVDIRVVGNDAGEKISILDGTLARIDRNAPDYGPNTYSDFNTFYIQAASNTSGGSSGSPVVDIEGRVVALNAGGNTQAASSFYLPLDRVVRAFEYVRKGEVVPRGTLQTTFVHTPYDELERLGLSDAAETTLRRTFPALDGALVVQQVLPGGPADGLLLPGDVLVSVDGAPIADFVGIEAKLDDAVGETLKLGVERGGRALDVQVPVGDLHTITPAEYLEIGRAVLTPLSYIQARNNDLPVQGVYVSVGGYWLSTGGVPAGSVITSIDGEPVPDLDAVERILASRADGERLQLRFFTVDDDRHPYEAVVVLDRRWFPMRRCRRDDTTGRWPCAAEPPVPERRPEPRPQSLIVPEAARPASRVVSALVRVDFDIPHPTAGVKDLNYVGVGVVVDAERGLVIVDRDTVPVRLGDLRLTFAGAVRVPAEVRFLHPVHNFAIVQYDPASIGDVPVQAVDFSSAEMDEGDPVWLVGLDPRQGLVNLRTTVERIEPLELGLSQTPRYRDANLESIETEDAESTLGGVLTDKAGRVVATWASFLDQAIDDRQFHGLPVRTFLPSLRALQQGDDPEVRIAGFELERITLDAARDRGLSDARIREILKLDPERRTLFEVARIHGQAPAMAALRNTDIVLLVNGVPLDRLTQLDDPAAEIEVTFLRDGAEQTERFASLVVDGHGVDRVVSWAGLIVHEPHYEVAAQKALDPKGVYIAWLWFGSPAARFQLRPTYRILMVDDTETPDLDAFLAAVSGLRDSEPVRLTMESLGGTRQVATLKMDLQYWPTQVIEVVDGRWQRERVRADGGSAPR